MTEKIKPMSIRLKFFPGFLCGITMLFASGCVTKRTVTEGGAVVAQGYVVKRPFLDRLKGH